MVPPSPKPPQPESATPHVYCFTSDPVALNSYMILTLDPPSTPSPDTPSPPSAVIVDTGAGPNQATRILNAFRTTAAQITNKELITDVPTRVINTHDHWDHFFGNRTFARAGVTEFYTSPQCAVDMQASAWVQFHSVPLEAEPNLPANPADLLVPMRQVGDGDGWDDLGLGFLVLPGHTEGDLVVTVGHLALVGDLVEEGATANVGDDATPARWADNLHRLLANDRLTVFAPGHGKPVDRTFVARQALALSQVALEGRALEALHMDGTVGAGQAIGLEVAPTHLLPGVTRLA